MKRLTKSAELAHRASRRSRSRNRGERMRGFSLLEVLVAFVILALVATALFELFGGSLRNAGAAEDWSRALLVAESRLATTASTAPLKERTEQGTEDDGRMVWQISVQPYVIPDANPELERASETMATRLYRIVVDVRFPAANGRGERIVSLSTVKLGARSPQ
jgi:general secretion pathway protein I